MDKNLIWKSLLIAAVVCFAALNLYPPQEKLKQGLDLQGGTSLIYEIDTTGLAPDEQKDLAQNMIPILLKRIDPTHVANIVMRPQGDTRIEIHLPMASLDTRNKREAYENALLSLEQENINLLKIRQALTFPAEERTAAFEAFANGSEERRDILNNLTEIYDTRKEAQTQRDALTQEMEKVEVSLKELGIQSELLGANIKTWSESDADKQKESIREFISEHITEKSEQAKATELVSEYVDLYGQWAPLVNQLAQPEDGLNAKWNAAVKDLSGLNLSIDMVRDVLLLPADSQIRTDKFEEFKTDFPGRAGKIDAVAAAYDEYRVVGGRLDDPEDLKRMLKGSGVLEFRILPSGEDVNIAQYQQALAEEGPKAASKGQYIWCEVEDPQAGINGIVGTFGEKTYVLCSNKKNETMLHGGEKKWKLKKAYPTQDRDGRRAIGFVFDEVAANKFYSLTSSNIGKPLCILLDDQAISAPGIDEAIRSSGIIRGSFTQTEVTDMVNKLNAGSFPARLSEVPISEKTISATIGADNRESGIKAGLFGLAAVVVFMLGYYLLSGAIANVALLLNILLVLGIMAMLQATFTLPGIAGLILTIGMSVDANVLIFERIREEQKRGSSVKAAIANGYGRAFRTIFDANITTFGVAAILYMAASEEIKGFAIVLMLGIVSSMFTALFVTRVIFDTLTGSRTITNHLAMPFEIARNSKINWMALRPLFLVVSAALIVGGLGVFFSRNNDDNSKYDIEFIGGTSVEIELKEGTNFKRAAVEDMIKAQGISPVKVYEIGDTGLKFEISTTLTNKTTALLTFNDTATTPETVAGLIQKAGDEIGRPLTNLNVLPKAGAANAFEISTSRVNASLVEEVLNEAVGETAVVSDVVVQELVSDAVREAFKEYLAIRENLELAVVSEERIETGSEDAALLSDFLGGVKLECQLGRPATITDLENRIRDLQFKPDMQDIEWHRHQILKTDITDPLPDEKLTTFIYVTAHPEAGYRELDQEEWQKFIDNETTKIQNAASLETTLSRVTQIDPSIGAQAKQRAIVAIVLSLIAIVGYIWIRFGTARYGFAAIAALVHDVCITLGVVTACTLIAGKPLGNALGIQDFKINLEMIAAFLTIIGYSLNDTIVVFDRIRENRGKLSILTPAMITTSINQTLSRTLLTSFTTFLVVLVMYIWGGTGLRGFTFAMLVGIIVGTYSSIAIAAPILLLGQSRKSGK